ncbi:MAG: dihydroorotase family protein [Patescibacteria group bacterium]|nr:dihydroorotase family protein [Patescibacteria group bacterium]
MDKLSFMLPKRIIDGHVHGRDMDQAKKSTVLQIVYEAVLSGLGIICLMPNTDPPINNLLVLKRYLNLIDHAQECFGYSVLCYVLFGVTDNNLTECEKALEDPKVVGLKIYPWGNGKPVTTGTCGVANPATIIAAMRLAKAKDKVVEVHCDDPEIIAAEGYTIRAEVEYDRMVIECMRQVPGARVKICHVSCWAGAELILAAQAEGLRIALEICAQYLWFDDQGANWRPGLSPNYYQCLNRLRGPDQREKLVGLLSQDSNLIIVSSDHAPHTKLEKLAKDFPSGIVSLHERVPVAVTFAKRLNISEAQVARLISFNEADFLGLTIDRELVPVEIVEREDDFVYNNGAVENPWLGSKMFFPDWKDLPFRPEVIF